MFIEFFMCSILKWEAARTSMCTVCICSWFAITYYHFSVGTYGGPPDEEEQFITVYG